MFDDASWLQSKLIECQRQRDELLAICRDITAWVDAGGPMKQGEFYTTPATDAFGRARAAIDRARSSGSGGDDA